MCDNLHPPQCDDATLSAHDIAWEAERESIILLLLIRLHLFCTTRATRATTVHTRCSPSRAITVTNYTTTTIAAGHTVTVLRLQRHTALFGVLLYRDCIVVTRPCVES